VLRSSEPFEIAQHGRGLQGLTGASGAGEVGAGVMVTSVAGCWTRFPSPIPARFSCFALGRLLPHQDLHRGFTPCGWLGGSHPAAAPVCAGGSHPAAAPVCTGGHACCSLSGLSFFPSLPPSIHPSSPSSPSLQSIGPSGSPNPPAIKSQAPGPCLLFRASIKGWG
jgi:hypothetical protein